MDATKYVPIVAFDFDGVIHSYSSGWKGATEISDPPVPGIKEAIEALKANGFKVIIHSSRCGHDGGRVAIFKWLRAYGMADLFELDEVTDSKPPAIVTVDDRCICFDGKPETLLEKVRDFTPWYRRREA